MSMIDVMLTTVVICLHLVLAIRNNLKSFATDITDIYVSGYGFLPNFLNQHYNAEEITQELVREAN